jgi:hypothetical protein
MQVIEFSVAVVVGLIIGMAIGIIIAEFKAIFAQRLIADPGQSWSIDGLPNHRIHQLYRLYVELGNLLGGRS